MKVSLAIMALIGSIALASPVTKPQFGKSFDKCSLSLCPPVFCGGASFSTCLCQNAAELSCKRKCPLYIPQTGICRRQYGPADDENKVDDDDSHDDVGGPNIKPGQNLEDNDDKDPNNNSDDGTEENHVEGGDYGTENGGEDDEVDGNNNGHDSNGALIEVDATIGPQVHPGSQNDDGSGLNDEQEDLPEHERRERENLINLDLEIKRLLDLHIGLIPDHKVQDKKERENLINLDLEIKRLLDLHLRLLPDHNGDVQYEQGEEGLINLDLEIRRLLDLRVEILPGNDESAQGEQGDQDGERGNLINLDLEIKHLLDLRVGLLRRTTAFTTK